MLVSNVLNSALTQEEALMTIAVAKFSENSQENCFLGCLSTNVSKWVHGRVIFK